MTLDGYTVAIWCCALMMTAGFTMLAWMLLLEEIRWRRRWHGAIRAEWPAPRRAPKPEPAPAPRTFEEYAARLPVARLYFGPDMRSPSGRRVLSLAIGKNWGAGEGDVAYRLIVELAFVRDGWRTVLWGPFTESASWTGREPVEPCDAYVMDSPRRLRIWWSFAR